MRKKLLLPICAAALALLVCLSACGAKTDGMQGSWKDNRFTDASLGVTFTLPDEAWTVLSEDQVRQLTGLTELSAYRMFLMQDDGNLSLQLFTVPAEGQDAQSYLTALQETMQQAAGTEYLCGEIETRAVGGAEFVLAPAVAQNVLAPNGDSTAQWMLARAHKKEIICIGITFAASLQPEVERLLEESFVVE